MSSSSSSSSISLNSPSHRGLVFTYNKLSVQQAPALRTTTTIRYRTLNMHNSVNNNISSMNSIINTKRSNCSTCGN